ncbi:sulfate reduction electron transfer complex DsrMKJOP subunit DsrM [Desulfohalobiaceae bacterium Ax17]|jgi:nitrate reductase gamma subunit|uniref:sulfate reduction electron transfer complex DsrMKJOP subunit DsrM n=1 Tax=Desulfovulcanus ferrireducens TaxID=2831190 RepID=UPI00207BA282|nr:sulfate reduction electron transfer complex DsrMKJOP subunit DsrM [Desulfovulcanus ferrireducens]MBT8762326.1 sulfate reduction electron transfer complex DsrMKJOP subunit DsrM [Desulfovulcanus ferrireducens]
MKAIYSLFLVFALVLVALLGAGAGGMHYLFGVIIPYVAVVLFVVGFVLRVIRWGKSPVPFRIPTTCGQEFSLPWIKQNKIDNPSTTWGVILRMFFEVVLFRSLFRNTKVELHDGPKLAYASNKWLWLFALLFHYSFLTIFLRHMRFFTEPVPGFFQMLDSIDGMLQIGAPTLYLTDVVIVVAVTYLFMRRVVNPQVRYVSLPADYFPLFLILGIVLSGIFMRYFIKTDIVAVKELTMGLVTFNPKVPEGVGTIFYIHVFLVSVLLIYFPLSKLMHMGGVFLSPTRNLANNSRMKTHVNPWNYPVKIHTYEAYEDEFRERMVEAGLPVEKPLEQPVENKE